MATKEEFIDEIMYKFGLLNEKDIIDYITKNKQYLNICYNYNELDNDRSVILDAIDHWQKNVLEAALKLGADPDIMCGKDAPMGPPLNLAIIHNWKEGVKLLLEYGADVSKKDFFGGTPLDLANKMDDDELDGEIRQLLEEYSKKQNKL